MPTSSEFINLCQSQVALLTQGLGAALSIVYLAEELTTDTDTHLVPIVAHPEIALNWGEDQILSFLTQVRLNLRQQRLLASQPHETDDDLKWHPEAFEDPRSAPLSAQSIVYPPDVLLPQQQIVLPFIYQDRVMGLLVTARADRAWNEAERGQIEHIAESLAAACVLDWRVRWLAQDLQQQQLLEERKADLFDNLLHQFRNPLTALRTFGKLLVKRMQPSDVNHSAAEGIVRESDRLQDLLKQLDMAVDLEADDLIPLLPAPLTVPQTSHGASDQVESPSEPAIPSHAQTTIPHPSVPISTQASPQSLPPSETRLLLGSAIDLQPHTITEVLQPLLDSATMIAQDRQLALRIEIASLLPQVWIDLRALREVLNNLLDNALKYTPARGQVYVGVRRVHRPPSDTTVTQQAILIADTGPGIPAEDLHHLFERHYRGVQAKTDIPGTGLGLAIARDLVRQMQGEIEIFSPALDCKLLTSADLQPLSQEYPGTAAVVWLNEWGGT
jgi:signal transduction histidine kinase